MRDGCPKCGSDEIVQIVFPYKGKDVKKDVEKGKAVASVDLGYSWECKKCKKKW